jgi:peroxin-5
MSVSLTNEGYEVNAVSLLNRWICAKYGFTLNREDESISREELTNLFLKALKENPTAKSDTDLQLGLGLLKYNQFEFDKAVDCFELAVNREPMNSILWNTLGATLANSGKSETALENYQKALSLRPGFIRARHNMAIGCINIGCYEHAASNLVKCLEIQSIGQVNVSFTSDSIWETLKRCFNLMNNPEMVEKCNQRDLEYFIYQYSNDSKQMN